MTEIFSDNTGKCSCEIGVETDISDLISVEYPHFQGKKSTEWKGIGCIY